jgi:hypothetical protein
MFIIKNCKIYWIKKREKCMWPMSIIVSLIGWCWDDDLRSELCVNDREKRMVELNVFLIDGGCQIYIAVVQSI